MANREGHLRTPWEAVGLNCLGGSWQRRRRESGGIRVSEWLGKHVPLETGGTQSPGNWSGISLLLGVHILGKWRKQIVCQKRRIAVDQVPIELLGTAERAGVVPTFNRPPPQHSLNGEPWICVSVRESKWVHTHFRRAALSIIGAGRKTSARVAVLYCGLGFLPPTKSPPFVFILPTKY